MIGFFNVLEMLLLVSHERKITKFRHLERLPCLSLMTFIKIAGPQYLVSGKESPK